VFEEYEVIVIETGPAGLCSNIYRPIINIMINKNKRSG